MNLIHLATEAKFLLWQQKDDARMRRIRRQRKKTVMDNHSMYQKYLKDKPGGDGGL